MKTIDPILRLIVLALSIVVLILVFLIYLVWFQNRELERYVLTENMEKYVSKQLEGYQKKRPKPTVIGNTGPSGKGRAAKQPK